jgi:hypothetical protein
MKLSKAAVLYTLSIVFTTLLSASEPEIVDESSPNPFNMSFSHNDGRGIGYSEGYTSVDLLYTPSFQAEKNMQYFLDARAHMFNDGKSAANVGLGARYLDYKKQKVYGANLFYDYRQVHHDGFQQMGLGIEVLGKRWDFRMNGYIPFGRNKVDFGHTLFIFPEDLFTICKQREKVMAGFDAEFGMPIWKKWNTRFPFELYAASGIYYFTPKIYSNCGRDAWGCKLRVAADVSTFLRLEVRTTYDREFRWRGEGVISVSFPIGGASCEPQICCDYLRTIAIQPVVRQEMIVVSKAHRKWDPDFDRSRFFDDSSSSNYSNSSFVSLESYGDSSESSEDSSESYSSSSSSVLNSISDDSSDSFSEIDPESSW